MPKPAVEHAEESSMRINCGNYPVDCYRGDLFLPRFCGPAMSYYGSRAQYHNSICCEEYFFKVRGHDHHWFLNVDLRWSDWLKIIFTSKYLVFIKYFCLKVVWKFQQSLNVIHNIINFIKEFPKSPKITFPHLIYLCNLHY